MVGADNPAVEGTMSALPDVYDGPDDIPVCPICGSEDVDWVDCPECGGKGGFDSDDLMSEDPLWYEGVEWETCQACHGDGGWWQCFEGDKHPQREAS